MTKTPLLGGEGVAARDLEDLARNKGFSLASKAQPADILLVARPERQQLASILSAQPPYAVIEAPAPDQAFGGRLKRALENKGLLLSLSTATGFNADLTSLLCAACRQRMDFSDERLSDIETAVEEALSNAMVHGNLDIASVLRNDPADFDQYCDLVNERLTTPNYADRRIEILMTWSRDGIDVEVHDEGRGYDISNFQALPQVEAKCGRGFSLIRDLASNVTIAEHGRSLTMSFAP
ncbi:MAG: ATP-binding protein [Rhodospirillales bacterium]|nr:ATP-binding protein [Rhodospirillales bacterium]